MKSPICVSVLLLLPACTVFGGLSDEERKQLDQHRVGAGKFFNARQFEKAIDQAERGLALDPDDYELKGRLAWSYLQMSLKPTPENEKFLRLAELSFADVLGMRHVDDQDPKNIFGYAIALHNRARIEEDRADRSRRESKNPGADNSALEARAAEHENLAQGLDRKAQHYFTKVADGSFAEQANRREAFKYLMAIEYRRKNYAQAIAYGKKNLELNAKEGAHWQKRYQTTEFTQAEKIIRREIADLKKDELKVRSRLAAYYQEQHDYRSAIVELDAILKARPNSPEDYYFRATCHRSLNQHDEARKDFRKFLQLGKLAPDHPTVKDAYDYLHRGK